MKENKYMGSIAGRINRSFTARLFWLFAIVDIVVFVVVAYNIHGGFSAFSSISKFIGTIEFLAIPVFAAEGFFLVTTFIFGTGKIRRKMQPLNEIARTAQRLGEESSGFNPEKFHDLEDAISRISQPDEKLAIGDNDLKGLESAVNSLLDRVRESYRQQSRFVSDASHELRTPISVIQGYANMLDRWGKQDEKILTESITAIKSEAENMKRLVEQLLFLARGDTGHIQLNKELFSLSDMIKEVYEESVMINSTHSYRLEIPERIEAFGDASMLKQTARILAENAAKYNTEGETIILRVGKDHKGTPYFSVQDAGIGIKAGDAPHIFERFYRADSSRTRGTGGTGLGLSIAKWIVDRHDAYFEVLSTEGLGTRITVYLPKNKAEQH